MRLVSVVAAAMLLIATTTHAADARAVIAVARQCIETADLRATGRLVRVDASGNRISNRQVEVKKHGRPGSTLVIIERGNAKANLSIRDISPEQISQFQDRP
jgi:hypothetical protein